VSLDEGDQDASSFWTHALLRDAHALGLTAADGVVAQQGAEGMLAPCRCSTDEVDREMRSCPWVRT